MGVKIRVDMGATRQRRLAKTSGNAHNWSFQSLAINLHFKSNFVAKHLEFGTLFVRMFREADYGLKGNFLDLGPELQ